MPQRPGSPRLGTSTLTTSAPNQASASVQEGPASNCVRSSTLMPLSAGGTSVAVSGCLTCSCIANPPIGSCAVNSAALEVLLGQLCQAKSCALRVEPCDSMTLTSAGPSNF